MGNEQMKSLSKVVRLRWLVLGILLALFGAIPAHAQSVSPLEGWLMQIGDPMAESGPWVPITSFAEARPPKEGIGNGISWYRREIQLSDQPMALILHARWRAVEVYLDGRCIRREGRIGTLTTYGPWDRRVVIPLPVAPGKHRLDLRVQVGTDGQLTHPTTCLALETPVWFGPMPLMEKFAQAFTAVDSWNRLKDRLPYVVLVAIFAIMGLWHLHLFMVRRERSYLWFGVLLLMMAVQQFGLGGWPKGWPIPAYRVSQGLFVQYYLTCVVFIEFLRCIADHSMYAESRRWLRIYQWTFLIPMVALFVLPPDHSLWFARRIGSLWPLPSLVGFVMHMVRMLRSRHPDAPFMLAGGMILLVGGCAEAGYFLGLTKGIDALGCAFALFLACMAMLVNIRHSRAYDKAERLARTLQLQGLERERMFREIHEEYKDQLNSAMRMVDDLARQRDAGELAHRLPAVGDFLDQCLGELRDMMWLLRDGDVSLADLALQFRDHVSQRLSSTALRLEFSNAFEDSTVQLNRSLRFHLFRILQEWTTNTLMHADAHTITLRFQSMDGQLALRYADDGCGFDAAQVKGRGHGLDILRHRCDQIHGLLRVQTAPGEGFQATLHITLDREAIMPSALRDAAHASAS